MAIDGPVPYEQGMKSPERENEKSTMKEDLELIETNRKWRAIILSLG